MLYLGANNKILKNQSEYIYLALIQKYMTIYKFIKTLFIMLSEFLAECLRRLWMSSSPTLSLLVMDSIRSKYLPEAAPVHSEI